MAEFGASRVRDLAAGGPEVIRVDAAWFAMEPLDMRAGVDTALARVVSVFGEARVHHAYLFANKRANRLNVLIHDGFGLWLCARPRAPARNTAP
jgi:transposase